MDGSGAAGATGAKVATGATATRENEMILLEGKFIMYVNIGERVKASKSCFVA